MSPPPPGQCWRARFDAWGGPPVAASIVAVLAVVAVLIALNPPAASAGTAPYVPIARAAAAHGRVLGDPNAPVRIVAYEDFQCPYCRVYTTYTEPAVVREFVETGIASIEFHPLSFLGEDSKRAAEAAECAADQHRFWEFHDVLFLRQGHENAGAFGAARLKRYAREVAAQVGGFDVEAFDRCLQSGEKRAVVAELARQAQERGIFLTPSFEIDGRALPDAPAGEGEEAVGGSSPIERFRRAIATAQAAAGR
ncbi:MAG: hypothetical protein EXR65_04915 [Dehalococcoidia bacterium]|nr:hypothetical protein [Dehalococcoidia bacterium]